MSSIYSDLIKDHRRVSGLFEELEELFESGRKEEAASLFEQLAHELDVHTKLEERVLYPRLLDTEDTHSMTLEAEEEHRLVKQLLEELGGERKRGERWFARLKVLRELVEHHVQEEERELFRVAKKLLDEEEQKTIGKSLVAQRARLTEAHA